MKLPGRRGGRGSKPVRRRSAKAGLPPGTLVHIGEERTAPVRLTLIQYRPGTVEETPCKDLDDVMARLASAEPGTVSWLDVGGVHDVGLIEQVGKQFQLHPLLLEDVVNTEQRPKREDYGSAVYVVLKMLEADALQFRVRSEQVSFVLLSSMVLSFQENGGDVFAPVRERLRTGKGRVRQAGADYLFYSLLDTIVDNYFVVLELLGERIEDLEDRLLQEPVPDTLQDLYALKRELLYVRRATWPLREVMSGLDRGESELITPPTRVYVRDVYDHVIQVIDTLETLRETVAEMLDIYLSSVSNRMTAVMKVLTIITTIFMPLSFIAGLYGMNFPWMPGLQAPWGYAVVVGIMVAIGLTMLAVFKRKRWL